MKQKIIAFLNNELSDPERHEFEEAFLKDPELKQEFDFQKDKYDKLKAYQLKTIIESLMLRFEYPASLRKLDETSARLIWLRHAERKSYQDIESLMPEFKHRVSLRNKLKKSWDKWMDLLKKDGFN
jgi:hypothetical protein